MEIGKATNFNEIEISYDVASSSSQYGFVFEYGVDVGSEVTMVDIHISGGGWCLVSDG